MKKVMIILILCFSLLGCKNKELEFVENLEGKYFFEECVYLSVFSSSTIEYFSEQHSGIVYVVFNEKSIEYHSTEQAVLVYDNVEYHNVSMTENLDDSTNLISDNVLSNFEYRFDIYSDDTYTGLTLFVNEDHIFLAELSLLGSDTFEYTIWTIFTLSKNE